MALACKKLLRDGLIDEMPLRGYLAAVSAGIVDNTPMLDLCYEEDSHAMVDLNCVMTEQMQIVEIQGTGEGRAFSVQESESLIKLCAKGIRELIEKQKAVIGDL